MKKALLVMLIMFLLIVWPLGGVWQILLKPIIGGGTSQSFVYPLYVGVILLAGIVVACAERIVKEIRSDKKDV